jgi:hypothetical protein
MCQYHDRLESCSLISTDRNYAFLHHSVRPLREHARDSFLQKLYKNPNVNGSALVKVSQICNRSMSGQLFVARAHMPVLVLVLVL